MPTSSIGNPGGPAPEVSEASCTGPQCDSDSDSGNSSGDDTSSCGGGSGQPSGDDTGSICSQNCVWTNPPVFSGNPVRFSSGTARVAASTSSGVRGGAVVRGGGGSVAVGGGRMMRGGGGGMIRLGGRPGLSQPRGGNQSGPRTGGGFGVDWGHKREFNNRLTAQDQGDNGNSWVVSGQPYITHDNLGGDPNLTTQIVMMDAYNALWFDYSGGNYTARFGVEHTLVRDATNKYFKLTTPLGEVFQFHDHSTSWAEALRGRFYSYTDPYGTGTTATYSSNKLASLVFGSGGTTKGYYYDYYSAGENAGKIQQVTYKVNGTNVRRNVYTYYGSSESYGSLGDLKRDNQEQWNGSGWDDLGARYYRYYKSGDANGFTHGLKYEVDPEGYARLVAGGSRRRRPPTITSPTWPRITSSTTGASG